MDFRSNQNTERGARTGTRTVDMENIENLATNIELLQYGARVAMTPNIFHNSPSAPPWNIATWDNGFSR